MPSKDYCDITIVLDRSGSMSSVQKDVEGGFNAFVETQRKVPGRCTMTLVQFDTEYEFVYRGQVVGDVPKLSMTPRGMTALLDAVGRAIAETGLRYKGMAEEDRPEKVVFVIITDGLENASVEYKREQIFEMIRTQRETYKWEFVFLAANQDAIQTGASMGMTRGQTMTYQNNSDGIKRAFASVSSNVDSYRSGRVKSTDFSTEDRLEQEKHKSGGKV